MFCDHCGAQLQSGQPRCARCGKAALGLVELRRSRVREHIRLLGILWLAYSALHLMIGAIVVIVAETVLGRVIHISNGPSPEITAWLRPLLCFIGCLVLIKAAAGFMAGWGILQHEEWARVFALVMGFIALLNMPAGTGLGIYTLWVLLPSQSDDEYKALAEAA
jgi:hypothetical protein